MAWNQQQQNPNGFTTQSTQAMGQLPQQHTQQQSLSSQPPMNMNMGMGQQPMGMGMNMGMNQYPMGMNMGMNMGMQPQQMNMMGMGMQPQQPQMPPMGLAGGQFHPLATMGAPPPPQQPEQSIEDKNAAIIAKRKAQAAAKRKEQEAFNAFNNEPKKKINLFGDNNDVLEKAKIANHKKKKKEKFVTLPSTGLSEQQLFDKYSIQSADKIGAGAFARIKIIKGINPSKSIYKTTFVFCFHRRKIEWKAICVKNGQKER